MVDKFLSRLKFFVYLDGISIYIYKEHPGYYLIFTQKLVEDTLRKWFINLEAPQ